MIQQVEFTLRARSRGFHLITDEVLSHLPQLPKTGLLNLFVQHTSCALSICENWDPDVRGGYGDDLRQTRAGEYAGLPSRP